MKIKLRTRFKSSPHERAPPTKGKLHGARPFVQARRRLTDADTLTPLHFPRVVQPITKSNGTCSELRDSHDGGCGELNSTSVCAVWIEIVFHIPCIIICL